MDRFGTRRVTLFLYSTASQTQGPVMAHLVEHLGHAYFLWLNAGKPEGRDVEFWVQAEREVAAPAAAHSHIRRYFSLGFAFFLVLSIVLFALAAGAKGLLVAAVGFSVATASVFVAWLLGLLFGIPRSAVAASRRGSTDQHASNEIPNASESSINTNLEQISD